LRADSRAQVFLSPRQKNIPSMKSIAYALLAGNCCFAPDARAAPRPGFPRVFPDAGNLIWIKNIISAWQFIIK